MQSLFEGSMYVFVLEWTPALTVAGESIPHGFIFAGYMVAVMIGSNLFKLLVKQQPVEEFMRYVLAASACCLAVPILFQGVSSTLKFYNINLILISFFF